MSASLSTTPSAMAKEGKKDCAEVEPRRLLFVAIKITDALFNQSRLFSVVVFFPHFCAP